MAEKLIKQVIKYMWFQKPYRSAKTISKIIGLPKTHVQSIIYNYLDLEKCKVIYCNRSERGDGYCQYHDSNRTFTLAHFKDRYIEFGEEITTRQLVREFGKSMTTANTTQKRFREWVKSKGAKLREKELDLYNR